MVRRCPNCNSPNLGIAKNVRQMGPLDQSLSHPDMEKVWDFYSPDDEQILFFCWNEDCEWNEIAPDEIVEDIA